MTTPSNQVSDNETASAFTLPDGWHVVMLSDVCLKTKQVNPLKTPDKFFLYIDVSSVSNESFRITESKELLGAEAPSRARKLIQTNDVIFATVRPTLRRIAFVPPELDGQICSTGFCVIKANPDRLDPAYAYFYLLSERVTERVEQIQKGATYPAISDSDLLNQHILLPSLLEQRAIARALRAVQEAKEARQRELSLERERKAVLMQHLFTYGTRGEARKQTEIGEMPESWMVLSLGDITCIVSGGTPDRSNPDYWNGNIPWVRTGEINYNVIMEAGENITSEGLNNSSARIISKGTLLMAMYGQGVTRGRVAILGIDSAINQACAALRPIKDDSVDYLFYFLAFRYNSIRTLGHGANQKNLNSALIRSIPISLPTPAEQTEIAEVFRTSDNKISALEKEVLLLEELFKSMLEELMTGRLSAAPLVEPKQV